jgi:hypothetical protein
MARFYTAQFNGVAISAQQDLFELLAGTNNPIKIYELVLSQQNKTGDANEADLTILIKSGQTTTGSGGSAPSKVPLDVDDSASAATVAANNTTKASAGTIVTHEAWNWNIRVPFQRIWMPETRLEMKGARRMTIELSTTPAASITASGFIVWSEGD